MWPFTLSKRVVIKRNIDAPPADIVKMQHDLESLVRLNPLFRSIEKHPTKQDHWIISDNLPVLGFQTVSTFECHWVKLDNGVDSEVWAGMGTKLKSKYRVSESSEVTDDTTVEGLFFLMPYIIRTMTKAHEEAMDKLDAAATGRG